MTQPPLRIEPNTLKTIHFAPGIVKPREVVTSLGPAKPQRSHNNNNVSSMQPVDRDHSQLLAGSSSPPHRLCLETSFTSFRPRRPPLCDSKHLPWEFTSLVQIEGGPLRQDTIHDSWFGLAPLATPESLSEVSSISSRASTLGHHHTSAPGSHKKHASVTFVDIPVCHHFEREKRVSTPAPIKSWKMNLKQNFFSAENFVCVKSKTLSDSSPENGSLINENNDKFYSAESMTNDQIGCKESEHLDEENSSESSPLLSSLHLLTDEQFQNLFKTQIMRGTDDSISSGSFKSVASHVKDLSTSMDSVTVNAEVHRSEDKSLWTDNSDLLEDIEICLNLQGNDSTLNADEESQIDSSVKVETLPGSSGETDVNEAIEKKKTKYIYPILSVGRGESSV